jgi:hypothetical protein
MIRDLIRVFKIHNYDRKNVNVFLKTISALYRALKSHAIHGEMQYKFYFLLLCIFLIYVLKMFTITFFTEMHTTNHVGEHVLQSVS